MSEAWQIALFGTCFGGIGTIILGALWGFFFLWGKIADLKNTVVKLDTKFEDWLDMAGKLAAKTLHSPSNHLGIDGYLDSYIAHHHDMSTQEWADFHSVCKAVTEDSEATKLEKAQAEFLMELCVHKISRAGIRPT